MKYKNKRKRNQTNKERQKRDTLVLTSKNSVVMSIEVPGFRAAWDMELKRERDLIREGGVRKINYILDYRGIFEGKVLWNKWNISVAMTTDTVRIMKTTHTTQDHNMTISQHHKITTTPYHTTPHHTTPHHTTPHHTASHQQLPCPTYPLTHHKHKYIQSQSHW